MSDSNKNNQSKKQDFSAVQRMVRQKINKQKDQLREIEYQREKYQRELKKNTDITSTSDDGKSAYSRNNLIESSDFTPSCIKRRTGAVMDSMEQVQGMKERYPALASVEEAFSKICFFGMETYDLTSKAYDGLLAAAIWILDSVQSVNKMHQLYQYLPSPVEAEEHMMSSGTICEDLCYDYDLIQSMIYLLEIRNKKQGSRGDGRAFVNEWGLMSTEQKEQQRDRFPHRAAFEKVLALISEEDIRMSCEAFERKLWEAIDILLRCYELIEGQRKDLETRQKKSMERVTHLKEGGSLAVVQDKAAVREQLIDELQHLEEMNKKMQELQDVFDIFISDTPNLFIASDLEIEDISGSRKIRELISRFHIQDPYEICFAALYLLDNGSSLPWLYQPGCAIFRKACSLLPWAKGEYIDEHRFAAEYFTPASGIYDRYDVWDKKRSYPEGMPDPYIPIISESLFGEEEFPEMLNTAQLIYKLSGTLIPRNFYPFERERRMLTDYGLSDEEALRITAISTLCFFHQYEKSWVSPDYSLELERFLQEGAGYNKDRKEQEEKNPAEMNPVPDIPQNPDIDPEKEQLQKKNAQLLNMAKKLKEDLAHTQRELNKEKQKRVALEESTAAEHQELAQLREIIFNSEQEKEPEFRSEIKLPYTVRKRTVIFGGHETWRKAIMPMLPGARFVDAEMLPRTELIRNADVVWIQNNRIGHSYYYKIMNVIREHGIEVKYFTFASAEKCARQLAEEDRR